MKRITSVVLVLMLMFLPLLSASAASARASLYFSTYGIGFSKLGGGDLRMHFFVTGVEVSDMIGVSSFQMQRLSGGSWVNYGGVQSGGVTYNSIDHDSNKIFFGTAGETYRVYCIYVCDNSYGYGTQAFYSGSIVPN